MYGRRAGSRPRTVAKPPAVHGPTPTVVSANVMVWDAPSLMSPVRVWRSYPNTPARGWPAGSVGASGPTPAIPTYELKLLGPGDDAVGADGHRATGSLGSSMESTSLSGPPAGKNRHL